MNFIEAIQYVGEMGVARRALWADNLAVYSPDGRVLFIARWTDKFCTKTTHKDGYSPSVDDILATDWERRPSK